MDLTIFRRFKKEGGTDSFRRWESGATITKWSDASTPGQLGKRIIEGLMQRDLPDRAARPTNNAVHWLTGLAWGAQFGIIAGGAKRPRVWWGAVLGSVVWAISYLILPVTGLYKPIRQYDKKILARDLAAHLNYGLITGGVFAALTPRHRVNR